MLLDMAGAPVKDVKLPDNPAKKKLLLEKHADYIEAFEKDKDDYEYCTTEFLRVSGVYWGLTAMDLMGQLHRMNRSEVIDFVKSCQHPTLGGFSPTLHHDPHLLYTLSAIQILTLYDSLSVIDIEAVVRYVAGLQQPDGSFIGNKWGEVDTRFSFCSLATLALLGHMDAVDVNKAVEFVLRCMNFDGGFGRVPGSESHAGQCRKGGSGQAHEAKKSVQIENIVYCCVGALAVAGALYHVDADQLGWWLCERQLPSGGLNGRPEKLPDVCYSWWVLASLKMIGRLHWISKEKLTEFILASQDEETGGFSDRPGDWVDPFHTLFGLAGLSLLGNKQLKSVNPVLCMPEEVLERIGLKFKLLS